jgi:hypothetical protein
VLEFSLPGSFDLNLIGIDFIIEIYRQNGAGAMVLEGDTAFFIRQITLPTNQEGVFSIYVKAFSALELLTRRIVAYFAGTSYTDKVGIPWDNLCREIVNENFGSAAVETARNLSPYLTVETDHSWGISYTKTAAWAVVLDTLVEIIQDIRSQGTYCSLDVFRTAAGRFQFRVFLGPRGVDHSYGTTNPVIVSQERKNLLEPTLDYNWMDEKNFIYCTGQGQESDRVLKTASSTERIGISPFNRREYNQDARQAEIEASVQAEANSSLEENRPRLTFTGKISQTEGCLYGINWKWGDIVTAEYKGISFNCHVDAVTVKITNAGTEVVEGLLRSVSDVR